jgi:hypothetical protein
VYVYFRNTLATSLFLRSSFSIPEVWGSALLKAEWMTRLGRRQSWADVKAKRMSMLGLKTTHAGQKTMLGGCQKKLGGCQSCVEETAGQKTKLGRYQSWAENNAVRMSMKAGRMSTKAGRMSKLGGSQG